LCKRSVRFFGHILTADGVKVDDSKVAAICKVRTPENVKVVSRFWARPIIWPSMSRTCRRCRSR
jgi:hypothetical protein